MFGGGIMKVKELIELLEEYDSDYTVYFENRHCEIELIRDIYFDEDTQSVTLF